MTKENVLSLHKVILFQFLKNVEFSYIYWKLKKIGHTHTNIRSLNSNVLFWRKKKKVKYANEYHREKYIYWHLRKILLLFAISEKQKYF